MPLHQRPTPTQDELASAYASVAQRDWPTLRELAEAARRYELVLGTALRQARPLRALPAAASEPLQPMRAADAAATHATRARSGPAPTAAPAARQPPPAFDRKRAAAGERPDD